MSHVQDNTHASPAAARLLTDYLETKSRHDVEATMELVNWHTTTAPPQRDQLRLTRQLRARPLCSHPGVPACDASTMKPASNPDGSIRRTCRCAPRPNLFDSHVLDSEGFMRYRSRLGDGTH